MRKSNILTALLAVLLALSCLLSCVDNGSSGIDNKPSGNNSGGSAGNVGGDGDINQEGDNNQEGEGDNSKLVFTAIGAFSEGLAAVASNQGVGYINTKGEIVIQPSYEYGSKFENGFACVKQNGKYGYIDTTGKLIIDAVYDEAVKQFDTLALVSKDGIQQYVNTEGQVIHTFTGNEVAIGEYCNGYYWVETKEELISGDEHKLTYYNEKGQVAFSLSNTKGLGSMSSFNEWGCALVSRQDVEETALGKKYYIDINTFVNTSGEVVSFEGIQLDYKGRYSIHTATIVESYFGKLGCVYPVNMDRGVNYYWFDFENLRAVKTPLKNTHHIGGDFYIGPNYQPQGYEPNGWYNSSLFYKGKELVLNSIEGLSDVTVCTAVHFEQDQNNFILLLLKSSSEVYFTAIIDAEGNFLLQPNKNFLTSIPKTGPIPGGNQSISVTTYEQVYNFSSGLCVAQDPQTGLFGYIDIHGNWIIEAKYNKAGQFSADGTNAVAIVNGRTVINLQGEIVFSVDG